MKNVIKRLEGAGMALSVLCILTIAVVVSFDALSRYLLNAPLSWAFELVTYYLMVGGVYFAISSTFQRGDHVNLNLLILMMPRRYRNLCDIVCCLMAAAAFGIIAYATAHHVYEAYVRHEFLPGIIIWPAWLSHLPIPLGSALLVLRLLHHAYVLAARGADPSVEENAEVME